MAQRDPIDRDIIGDLIDLGDGTDVFLRELVDVFALNSESLISSLHAAVEDRDAGAAREAAHSLKSSSGTVGALALSQLCQEAEAIATEGAWDETLRAVDAIESELAMVRAHLKVLVG